MKSIYTTLTLAVALAAPSAWAQTPPGNTQPSESVRTFFLTSVNRSEDATEITTALRNLLDPRDKVYLVPEQNAIMVRASAEQLTLAQKLITDLDHLKKTYRLTYTVAESDAGKRVGTQHFSMIVVAGDKTTLKQGSRIPIVTGGSGTKSDMTYIDVGMNFNASLDEFADGIRLRSKVEQSNLAEERSILGGQDPVIRQTFLEGTSILTPGKPLVLGSLDIPGSTRHLDVEVVMEVIR